MGAYKVIAVPDKPIEKHYLYSMKLPNGTVHDIYSYGERGYTPADITGREECFKK